jgi:predicted outer membrane repeat protein
MKKTIVAALLALGLAPTLVAQIINVSNFNDSGGGSLRAAITSAGASTTINVPAGTYNLTSGELSVAPTGSKTILIQSTGGQAIINQTDGTGRVFNIDPNSLGGVTVTLAGLTIQGGHDAVDNYGGAGILDGSLSATPKDVLTLTNCYVLNNHCKVLNPTYTGQPGGGVQMAGGDLTINSCVFSNNTSAASAGGAIEFFTQAPIDSNLRITNSSFFNNALTNTSGAGPDGGGAIDIHSTAGSSHVIIGSTFLNNIANTTGIGDTVGGAIYINTGVLNIYNSTFTGNHTPGLGGAIYVDSGTLNLNFCRLAGNSATAGANGVYNHGSNGASTSAANNWWGGNADPGLDADAVSNGGTLTTSPFIVLTNTASPASILPGQPTTLTASFLQNSAGTVLTASQITALLGLPVTWNNAVLGTLSNPQTTIQANGTATATFTAGSATGTGQASATVDNGTATASITLNPPLRFAAPSWSAGKSLQLILVNSDGSQVASNRAAQVHIYAATNLTQPFSQWTLLTNAVVPSNGQLQVNGLTTTNSGSRFFRALEIP